MKVTPPEGVKQFLKRFGFQKELVHSLEVMGVKTPISTIRQWILYNEMPEHIYNMLRQLVTEDRTQIAKGFVEVYFKGKPVGQLYLHRDCTLVVKRERE